MRLDHFFFDTHCYTCRAPITQPARGRRRVYCSDSCRQRRYRSRRRAKRTQRDFDRIRWDKSDQLADRRLRQLEARFGPFDDTPDPETGLSFRWRLRYRLTRDMLTPFCRWCGRPHLADGGPGLYSRCCSDRCRRQLSAFNLALDTGLHRFDATLDRRVLVRLRLNDPALRREVLPASLVAGICSHCGQPFPRYARDRRYCSKRCRQAAHRSATRVCPHCRRRFRPGPNNAWKHVYCSKACREHAARGTPVPSLADRRCPECGLIFTPDKRNAHKQVYCSKPCRMRHTRRVPPLTLSRNCAECGEPFQVDQRNRAKNIYCSRRCFDRANARARRKKNSPLHLVERG